MEQIGLHGHTLFQMLRPEQVKAISDAAEEVALEAGSPVYHRGDPAEFFYVVREGVVALRGMRADGVGLHVDEARPGEIFGACICFGRDRYTLDARCEEPTRLIRISAQVLKRLLDADPRLGYAVQSYISGVYFRRYVDTVTKLQAVVHSLPLTAA
jgi:CRP/FNR family cyclic AMP-dependent transcriptional regulator